VSRTEAARLQDILCIAPTGHNHDQKFLMHINSGYIVRHLLRLSGVQSGGCAEGKYTHRPVLRLPVEGAHTYWFSRASRIRLATGMNFSEEHSISSAKPRRLNSTSARRDFHLFWCPAGS
jgi:hypothetical protein